MSDDARTARECSSTIFSEVRECELDWIAESREQRGLPKDKPDVRNTLIGLALSGGGIRSATLNLGILQAFARHNLLRHFDFLSTVSGGGYVGSWLTAWRHRQGSIRAVEEELTPKPYRPGRPAEKHQVRWLRDYGNYLTPQKGLFTADTAAFAGGYLRNLILNWAVLLPFLFAIVLAPWLLFQVLAKIRGLSAGWQDAIFLLLVIGLMLAALRVALSTLAAETDVAQRHERLSKGIHRLEKISVTVNCLVPVFAATMVLPLIFVWWGTGYIGSLMCTMAEALLRPWINPPIPQAQKIAEWVILGVFIYTASWLFASIAILFARLWRTDTQKGDEIRGKADEVRVVLSVLGFAVPAGAAGGLGFAAMVHILTAVNCAYGDASFWPLALLGLPLTMLVFELTFVLHLGLIGTRFPDFTREWWARMGGQLLAATLIWPLLAFVAIYGPWLCSTIWVWAFSIKSDLWRILAKLGLTTVITGWIGAIVQGLISGAGAKTGPNRPNLRLDRLAKLAPPLFALLLVLLLSFFAHALESRFGDTGKNLVGGSTGVCFHDYTIALPTDASVTFWAVFLALVVAFGLAARVNVNDFSMHHLYRNRLVRCYIGASNEHRKEQPYTGFDPDDDLRLHEISKSGPYPIINTTLNVVRGRKLGLQTRKSRSFILSPLFSGYELTETTDQNTTEGIPVGAFCKTAECACEKRDRGISLGTAMAISGAAATPNHGYATSAALALLMTIFNVRLGWWLRNPRHRERWNQFGPVVGFWTLIREMLGDTDDDYAYVYVSDGGHFENLGIYELVRRRCPLIVACDASHDPSYTFEDLMNAIEKCRVDFGVEIEFSPKEIRAVFPQDGLSAAHGMVGTIRYDRAAPNSEPGTLIYIKSSLTGDEPADVTAYKKEHDDFPHISTADQWFDENRFEAYRKLGVHIGEGAAAMIAGLPLVEKQRSHLSPECRSNPPQPATPAAPRQPSRARWALFAFALAALLMKYPGEK